ncbi:substrate-binding and VWA domain-containing protein [Microbacterium yannicii]|uniref:Substrate-binding and VWA domain-containing protein n=1 Tax=Microbacterium yannicii TaxID=671622 RepID=A0ABP9LYW5_9MICO|nr:substrate-binding domain-containing protein [Microbacterium yannicii]MCO5953640.1 substrate-binding and VWA domain-containing protein [Microbacterium yannicii]
MRDQTRGDDDAPGPRRGQSSPQPTAPLPTASASAASPAPARKPSAIDERRERRRKRRRNILIWTTVVGIVVLVGSISTVSYAIVSNLAEPAPAADDPAPAAPAVVEPIVFPQDEPAATAGAQPCATVSVLSSFENSEMVESLAAAYNSQPRNVAGSCVTVTTAKEKSGLATAVVATAFPNLPADQKPTVWLPDSSTWVDVAQSQGATNLRADGTSVATSDVVIAMPENLAETIGWDAEAPTWSEIFEAAGDPDLWSGLGHPEWGAFKLGKTSPLMATSGEAAMYASYGTAAGSLTDLTAAQVQDPSVQAEVHQNETATSHYMATPEHFLWHARQAEASGSTADFLSAVIVDEKSVWDYNRGITSRDGITRTQGEPPSEQLVPIYPADGYYSADNPVMRLTGEWIDPVEAEAAADFIRFTHTAQGQSAVRAAGYRDLNRALDESVEKIGQLEGAQRGTLAFPAADVVTAVQASFPEVRKRANVLFLLDVSGSMDEPIPAGDTKLVQARKAIEAALGHFTTGDDVGLAAFAQGPDGAMLPGLVSPVSDIGTSRDAFLGALGGLTSMGDTPLYQAVDTFAAQQAASWTSDHINAIVLLSDGENDTPNAPTIGADQMLANLKDMHHATPVLIFTLAYGADADVATLQSISSATGAHYYDATDPSKLQAVLGDLVTSF